MIEESGNNTSDKLDSEGASQESEISSVEGTELDQFEAADIEEIEELVPDQIDSIVESVLFATDRPVSVSTIKQAFSGTKIRNADIRKSLQRIGSDYASAKRGVTLEEVSSGYQLRTKIDNVDYLKRMAKARPFKLSGPALEVLAIVAYKQPLIKSEVDQIRGVESGHLLRGLMEKGIVCFSGKSELPGKPMQYSTTRKFLEIFGLRNTQELPSLGEIDELLPEGIGDEPEEETLGVVAEQLGQDAGETYSEGEQELTQIADQLSQIETSSDFFEEEKKRQREKRDRERAQDIRDAMSVGEEVSTKDKNWLQRYDQEHNPVEAPVEQEGSDAPVVEEPTNEIQQQLSEDESAVEREHQPDLGDGPEATA